VKDTAKDYFCPENHLYSDLFSPKNAIYVVLNCKTFFQKFLMASFE